MSAFVYGTGTRGMARAAGAAGGISGTVTAVAGGARLSGVHVEVFYDISDDSELEGSAVTGSDGSYKVTGLVPLPPGYRVCFDASDARGGSSGTGYLSQCYWNVPWDEESQAPGATPVPVSAGRLTPGVDAALATAGGISGTVTAVAGGAGLGGVYVTVFTSSGDYAELAVTGADGTYRVTGLPAATPGYRVCFDASGTAGGGSGTGYLNQCYRNVPWEGGVSPASRAAPVPVSAGRMAQGVDAALGAAGGISGTVTAVAGGAGLGGVDVTVFTSGGDEAGSATTGADGTYRATGLPAATPGYRVCFDASDATGGGSSAGYLNQCYRNVPWEGGSSPAPGATPVPVSAGRMARAVGAALGAAGGISGTVTAVAGGAGLGGVDVEVFASSGDYEGSVTTGADGTYKMTGLPAATPGYRVCFYASDATGGSSHHGYLSQCYRNVPWEGGFNPAPGATPVPVTAGRLAPGVGAALNAADTGGISGTVTAVAGGARLGDVDVTVFTGSGDEAGSAVTGADGTYRVTGLAPAAPGYLVCFGAWYATGGSSSGGYLSQCYRGVPWEMPLDEPWNYEAPAPGAAPVPVAAGRLTPGVDAALGTAGGISGTVTAAAGGARLSGVYVQVFTGSGDDAGWATTWRGTYQVTGLAPTASGYLVCFDAGRAAGGSSPLGYASQCYRGVPWDYGAPAPGATPVPVAAGRLTPAVDAEIVAAGGISGTVTAGAAGARLGNVNVGVFNGSGDLEGWTVTGADGTYRVTGLPAAAPGYLVCFDASDAAGGGSSGGYLSQCYRGVPWEVPLDEPWYDGAPAPGAAPVPVAAGKLTPAVDAAIVAAGGISGTVTAAAGGTSTDSTALRPASAAGRAPRAPP